MDLLHLTPSLDCQPTISTSIRPHYVRPLQKLVVPMIALILILRALPSSYIPFNYNMSGVPEHIKAQEWKVAQSFEFWYHENQKARY